MYGFTAPSPVQAMGSEISGTFGGTAPQDPQRQASWLMEPGPDGTPVSDLESTTPLPHHKLDPRWDSAQIRTKKQIYVILRGSQVRESV